MFIFGGAPPATISQPTPSTAEPQAHASMSSICHDCTADAGQTYAWPVRIPDGEGREWAAAQPRWAVAGQRRWRSSNRECAIFYWHPSDPYLDSPDTGQGWACMGSRAAALGGSCAATAVFQPPQACHLLHAPVRPILGQSGYRTKKTWMGNLGAALGTRAAATAAVWQSRACHVLSEHAAGRRCRTWPLKSSGQAIAGERRRILTERRSGKPCIYDLASYWRPYCYCSQSRDGQAAAPFNDQGYESQKQARATQRS